MHSWCIGDRAAPVENQTVPSDKRESLGEFKKVVGWSVCVYNTKRINLLHNNILNTSPCAAILHKIFHTGEKNQHTAFSYFEEKS